MGMQRLRQEAPMSRKPASPILEKPSEISELIHQIMQERGGVPHNENAEATPENDEIRMAEAP